jgi:hypothetical protein
VSLVGYLFIAEERNPILYFPGKSWPAAGGGIAGTGSAHFSNATINTYITRKKNSAQPNIPINIYVQK